MTTALIILALLVIVLTVVIVFVIKKLIDEKKHLDLLEKELAKKDESISYLYKHAEEVAKLNAEKSKLDKEINEAMTDEEIADVVAAIVDANNSKLRVY